MESIKGKPIILNDVFKTNFSIFDDFTRAEKISQIGKLNYILNISKSLEKNISDLDITKFIPVNEKGLVDLPENEINKILIGLDVSQFSEIEVKPLFDPKVLAKNIEDKAILVNEMINEIKNSKLRSLKIDLDSIQNDYNERFKTYMREYKSKINDLDGLKIYSHIERLFNEGIIDNTSFHYRNEIELYFKDDVYIKYQDSNLEKYFKVNLGKFKMRFIFNHNSFDIKVMNYKNNLLCRGYSHPHVSSNTLCTGNMEELWMKARLDEDIYDLTMIAHTILNCYNHGSPYCDIFEFVKESKQPQPDGEIYGNSVSYEHVECGCCDCEYEIEVIDGYGESHCPECDTLNTWEE